MGRPKGTYEKYSPEFKAQLAAKLEEFIQKNKRPLILRFAVNNDIPKSTLYEFEELAELLKKARQKSELYFLDKLEEIAGNPTKYIAILNSCYGWRQDDPVGSKDNPLSLELSAKTMDKIEAALQGKIKKNKQNTVTKNQRTRKQ